MKVFLVIWITLVLFPCCLFAQGNIGSHHEIDENYLQYREVFDKEFNVIDTTGPEEQTVNSAGLSSVPAWLVQPLESSASRVQVIGISDPGIDSAMARSQAIYRALLLASLMNGTSLNNLVDYYSQDYDNSSPEFSGQYFDYFEFTGEITCEMGDAAVLKEQFTDFGECIVIIEYQVMPGAKPAYIFKTVGMINEFEKDGIYECNSRIESGGQSQTNSRSGDFRYVCRSVNGLADVESYYQDNLLPILTAKLKYRSPGPDSEAMQTEGVRTDRGLWNALLTSIIRSLTLEIRTQSAQVKSATDHYSGKTQVLNREAVTGILTFHLDQIYLYDNNLWAFPEQINFSQP